MSAEICETKRFTVPEIEEILYKPYRVLDHGFVRVVDYMGGDASIVQAARVSYGKGTKKLREDTGLINYLMRNKHTTPFEMCEIKFHIKLPIFVARQWVRHRTANINEYSARYSVLDKEFYLPDRDNIAEQSSSNAQGRGEAVDAEKADLVLDILQKDSASCYQHYEQMLDCNIARELARANLTLNYYTQWYWKIDLHNLLHFLKLRADPHAQYEIRAYASAMLDIVRLWTPITHSAFLNYSLNAFTFSAKSIAVVRTMLKGEKPTPEESGMSKREWRELMNILEVEGYCSQDT